MALIRFTDAAERLGMTTLALEKFVKNGKEFNRQKQGRSWFVDEDEFEAWQARRRARYVELNRDDFTTAFRFALSINYSGHTRANFGTVQRRSTTQAVENWTQGILGELALRKFIQTKFHVGLDLDLQVYANTVVGQDITAVIKNGVSNPPRKRISVKSGKSNGMFLIVQTKEVERTERSSDYYIYTRIHYSDDFIFRLFRDILTLWN